MKRSSQICLLLTVVLFLALVPVQSTSTIRVTFVGYVFDSDLATPVQGAVVRAWASDALGTAAVARTNWHGFYEGCGELRPGWYWLQAVRQAQKSRILCAYYDGGNPVRVDFSLDP